MRWWRTKMMLIGRLMQAERLSDFYEVCKGLDLARSFQFPTLDQPPQSFLLTMEEYVRDAPRVAFIPKDVSDYNDNRVLALPRAPSSEFQDLSAEQGASAAAIPAVKEDLPAAPSYENDDLLGLNEMKGNASAIEESNALALAIVPAGPTSNATTSSPDANGGWNLESGATG